MRAAFLVAFMLLFLNSSFAETIIKEKSRGVDKAFWLTTAVSAASTVADIEVTAHALQNPNCRERNPLFGTRPSRAKMYSISMPATTAYSLLGHVLKRHGIRIWAVPQLSLTAGHTVGAVLSAQCF